MERYCDFCGGDNFISNLGIVIVDHDSNVQCFCDYGCAVAGIDKIQKAIGDK